MNRHTPTSSAGHQPPLVIDAAQLAQLRSAVRFANQVSPEVADRLIEEIERAEVLPANQVPDNVVTLGRWVTYQYAESGSIRTIQLVLPSASNPALRQYSVASPIGVALIGLREGQVMEWCNSLGEWQRIMVRSVSSRIPHESPLTNA